MDNIQLDSDEIILLQQDRIGHNKEIGNLCLTNKRIVFSWSKGVFNKNHYSEDFPINNIKVYNNQAQAIASKNNKGNPVLQVYMLNNIEEFEFCDAITKRAAQQWSDKINALVNDTEVSTGTGSINIINNIASNMGEGIGTAISAFSNALGKKIGSIGSANCPSCGASIQGRIGTAVKCPYCDTNIQI